MNGRWTFGRKLAVGFAAIVLLTLAISATAIFALRGVVASKDEVIHRYAKNLIELKTLTVVTDRKSAALRGYLLTGHQRYVDEAAARRLDAIESIGRLRGRAVVEREAALVNQIERIATEHQAAAERVAEARRAGGTVEAVSRAFDEQVSPKRAELVGALDGFAAEQERALADAQLVATARAESASTLMMIMCGAAALLAAIAATFLTRTLGREIGGAVGKVQSSSSELQAAATQQATGAREQATSMTEISTTITELLATSRQIADTARGVASIAEQTAGAARAGDHTVQGAKDSMAIIRGQTDLMVGHVVELGKKSQRIGAVADIVSELAEQTNILAINATIEAAGAGEAGKRFAVVADEIRKLADRVGGSTKEIRGLIDDVRTAVNTSVMATEMGSKTVDAAARQFVDVATSFTDIARLVSTTTDATREIELSTKQQTTAVEQVNVAIANAAQATKETEASSGQTLQTASHLAALSSELSLLVRTPAA